MICFVGFAVFGVLGIFSATYRRYTLEAYQCMRDRVSGRPCSTNFDERYRAWAVDNVMKIDIRLASFVKSHFVAINWVIFVLTGILAVYTLEASYNLIIHGTCNPGGHGCGLERGWEWIT